MALPIWAHARGKLYDTVVMQDGRETWLGFHESLSSGEPYYCRPLRAQEINVDAITCPTRFTSAKGKLDSSTTSYYPPRNDLTTFSNGDCDMVGGVYPGCAASATSYAALNDLDAVAAATPPYGAPYTGTWTIPTTLPAGDYALLVEVNKEFDNNAAHTHPSYADPQLSGYGLTNNFGQPSVVYRVPIHIDVAAGAAAAATTSQIAGYSDWTGAERRDQRARRDHLDRRSRIGRRAPARDLDRRRHRPGARPGAALRIDDGMHAAAARARHGVRGRGRQGRAHRHVGRRHLQERGVRRRWRRRQLRDSLPRGRLHDRPGVRAKRSARPRSRPARLARPRR